MADADRIDVIGTGNRRVMTIDDPARVRDALAFLGRFEEGWIEEWTGPKGPELDLTFYKNNRQVGEFGIASNYITVGLLLHRCPEAEITSLAKRLGIPW